MRDAHYSSCFGLRSAAIHRKATNPRNTIPIKIRFSIDLAFPKSVCHVCNNFNLLYITFSLVSESGKRNIIMESGIMRRDDG